MKEIELKILELPKRAFLQKMRDIGAKKIHSVLMRVRYFDFPDNRIQKARDLLRVRELSSIGRAGGHQNARTEVVYKTYRGIKDGCKHFDECEFEIEGAKGFAAASEFLQHLGFAQTLYYEKKRTLFAHKKWKFEFDEHPKIPPFLEIEAKNARDIHAIIKKLGWREYECTPETIEQVLKRKYPKIRLDGLKF